MAAIIPTLIDGNVSVIVLPLIALFKKLDKTQIDTKLAHKTCAGHISRTTSDVPARLGPKAAALARLEAAPVEILDGYSSAPPLHRRNPFRVFFIAFFSFYILVPFRSFPPFSLLFTIHIK